MAYVFGDQINLGQALPLDSRQVVEGLSDVEFIKYEGMIVFDKSDKKLKVCVEDAQGVLRFVEVPQAVQAPVRSEGLTVGIAKVYGNNDDYGTATEEAANCCSHGFIELYNYGKEPVAVEGLSLRIVNPKAALVHELKLAADAKAKDVAVAKQIAPSSSFLIRCKETPLADPRDPMSVLVPEGGVHILDADTKAPLKEDGKVVDVLADQECPELFVKEGMQIALVAANGAVLDEFVATDLGKTKIMIRKSQLIVETEKLLDLGNEIYAPKCSLNGTHSEVFRYEPVTVTTSGIKEADLLAAVRGVVELADKSADGLAALEKLMVELPISGDQADEFGLEEAKVMGEVVMTKEHPAVALDLEGTKLNMIGASQAAVGQPVKIAAPLLYLAKNPLKITLKDSDFASAKISDVATNGAITKLTTATITPELVEGAEGDTLSLLSISKKGYANLEAVVAAKEVEDRKVKIALPGLMAAGDKVMMRLGDGEVLKGLKVVTLGDDAKVEIDLAGLAVGVEHEIVLAVVKEDSIVKVDIKLTVKRPAPVVSEPSQA